MSEYCDTLISAEICERHYRSPDWLFVDCRFDLAAPGWGPESYRESHIPGAVYAHLDRDLAGPPGPRSGRHPLPDWRLFAERLGRWGLHPTTQVIVYDQGSGALAARLWWLLRAIGHRRVAVLDGGWAAWQALGGAQSDALALEHARDAELCVGSGWVTTREIEENLSARRFLLVDARTPARFTGEDEPIDPVAGHIPGAVNFPLQDNLAVDGRFLDSEALRARWLARLGATPPAAVVHMCGSGVTACHNLLAMEAASLHGSRLYVGSWSEWIRDPAHPLATGPA